MTKVIQLIYTRERRGDGTDGDPVRLCPQLYTLDGRPVADSNQHFEDKQYSPIVGTFYPDALDEVIR